MSRGPRSWRTKVTPPKKYEEPLDPLLQQPKVILYAGDQSDSDYDSSAPPSPALSENFGLIPEADVSIPPPGPPESPILGSPEPVAHDPPAPPADDSDVPFMALPPGIDWSDLDDHNVPSPPTSTPVAFDLHPEEIEGETEEERYARLVALYSTPPKPRRVAGALHDAAYELTYGERSPFRAITPPLMCEQRTYGYGGAHYIPPSPDTSAATTSAQTIPTIIITPPMESPTTPISPVVQTPTTPVNQTQPSIYSPEINPTTPPVTSLPTEVDTKDNKPYPKRPRLTRRSRYESSGHWQRADNTER